MLALKRRRRPQKPVRLIDVKEVVHHERQLARTFAILIRRAILDPTFCWDQIHSLQFLTQLASLFRLIFASNKGIFFRMPLWQ